MRTRRIHSTGSQQAATSRPHPAGHTPQATPSSDPSSPIRPPPGGPTVAWLPSGASPDALLLETPDYPLDRILGESADDVSAARLFPGNKFGQRRVGEMTPRLMRHHAYDSHVCAERAALSRTETYPRHVQIVKSLSVNRMHVYIRVLRYIFATLNDSRSSHLAVRIASANSLTGIRS